MLRKLSIGVCLLLTACGSGEGTTTNLNPNQVTKVEVYEDHSQGSYILKDLIITTPSQTYEVFYANHEVRVGDECRVEDGFLLCNNEVTDILGYKHLTKEVH